MNIGRYLTLILAVAIFCLIATGNAESGAQGWHGNHFPNVVLTTHEGKKVRFYDDVIKGKVVSINFVYTTCGDVCPLDTAQMRQVQAELGDRVGKDVFMYSISLDPQNDTPAALARYMRTFDVGPGWTFLTGSVDDIKLLQTKLGLRIVDPKKVKDHDTRLVMGNEKTGHWIKRTPYDDPKLLAHMLGEALHNFARGDKGSRLPYEQATKIDEQTRGANLFRTRCDSCHTIGGGDRLGPDLAGVAAARPRAWLLRWLKEPDKMLAEKDPVATAMKARYRNLAMPNLGLNDLDATALIDYMAEMDRKSAPAGNGGGR